LTIETRETLGAVAMAPRFADSGMQMWKVTVATVVGVGIRAFVVYLLQKAEEGQPQALISFLLKMELPIRFVQLAVAQP